MATKKGVWNLQQVRDKQLQSLWSYTGATPLFAWGSNHSGQLGQNQAQAQLGGASSPIQIPGSWRSVSNDQQWNIISGVKTDGTMWAWGQNNQGQFGLNNRTLYSSPVQIPGEWSDNYVIGYLSSAMVKSDGTLWVSGFNNDGNLAQNDRTARSSPTQVPGTWSTTEGAVITNVYGAGAIQSDGTLWGWGDNHHGQLGQNNRTYYSSPIQIPGTTWSLLGGTHYSRFGIKTDGTLWGWGHNHYGVLGLGPGSTSDKKSSPTQIPGTWSAIANSAAASTAAINTDGELFMWGSNAYGQLGQNNLIQHSSPTQIPGTTWSKISISNDSMSAIKTDGTLWGWGKSTGGQLGQNTMVTVSSPVRIPGTWSNIGSSGSAKFGLQIN